ncbi:sensor histidine kinase [Flavobacterium terrae]|uniref:histidine kinase n=1 Tax=Flavobacterium terrae TaxID=415425 RepID=A0A1M6CZD8_9FLAO|nr:ATP-binding protein [Flavobacterium terrae]SHI66367.1 Histidine kinase [Flavobacterium terrae]
MEQTGNEGVIFATLGLAGLCFVIILLFLIFQKKKNILITRQVEAQKQFEKELVESQIEIREQTLRNISWELHDNIGQLITLAKIQLQKIKDQDTIELNENLTNILNEVRSLSKVTNPDYVSKISLEEAVKLEIDRFNRLNYIEASLSTEGDSFTINPKSETIIFRILQEFFSNTIKHSKATKLSVSTNYYTENGKNRVVIIAKDNGKGFDITSTNERGIGLINMKKRGHLINAEVNIESELNIGTSLSINYHQN